MKLSQFLLLSSLWVASANAANPPITPAWAFRHIVWEDSLNTSAGARNIVNGYLKHNIPVGTVIIDSPWSTSYNDFNWDRERYPDAEKMITDFKNKDVKVILWLTGCVNNKCKDTPLDKGATYDEAVEKNLGINNSTPGKWWKGEGIHIDFTNPEAKKWWYDQLDKVFIDGVYGWKVDQGEFWFGDSIETSIGKLSNAEFRPYYYDAMYDYTVARKPEGLIIARPFSHQGGYAASIGKVNMGWSGDFSGDWAALQHQIENIYNSAEHGYGSLACEVGGFYMKRSKKKELVRYAQFGCMTACMINGGENGAFTNHLPWYHGKDAEEAYRDCVVLHEELIPYLFSASVEANKNGGSLIKVVSREENCHLLGKSLFTKAITSEDDEVTFHLPQEGEWIDWWTGEIYAPGAEITKTYNLDKFPLFVKKGSAIPLKIAENSFWLKDNINITPGEEVMLVFPGETEIHSTFYLPQNEGTDYHECQLLHNPSTGKSKCITTKKHKNPKIITHKI